MSKKIIINLCKLINMYVLINLLIFLVIVFLYIHIYNHLDTSNYLEIYEVDEIPKEKFEELCNLKQPLIINTVPINNNVTIQKLISNYSGFDIKIMNINQCYNQSHNQFNIDYTPSDISNINPRPLPIKINTAIQLFNNDISGIYYSEYNSDFIQETTLEKNFENNDLFLRPYGVSNKFYDLIFGSKNSYSNLRCHLNSRNFLYVNEGSIEVTMCVPNDIKYLYVNKNYETMEYVSEINICNVESKYMQNFNKVKFLQVIIPRNKIIQIPPYWFYHIKILEDNTLITAFKYRTIMNNISIIPDLFIKFLQDNNVKRNFTKIVS
jgi:hypothetical protein